MIHWTIKLHRFLFFIYFFLNYSFIHGSNTTTSVSNKLALTGGRIVNGTIAELGDFPYIAALYAISSMFFFCAGSIIRERWILSAAHCVNWRSTLIPASTLLAIAGDLKLKPPSFYQQRSYVKKYIIHPMYDKKTHINDLVLLMLEKPFQINVYLQLADYPSPPPLPNTKCVTAGWGRLKESDHNATDQLRSVELPVLPQKECETLLKNIFVVGPHTICAGYMKGGKDTCQGDSGGPFECNGILTAVVGVGEGCARPRSPGLYTLIEPYIGWIHGVMKNEDPNGAQLSNPNILLVASLFILTSLFLIQIN